MKTNWVALHMGATVQELVDLFPNETLPHKLQGLLNIGHRDRRTNLAITDRALTRYDRERMDHVEA